MIHLLSMQFHSVTNPCKNKVTQYTNPSQVSRNLLPLTTIAQCKTVEKNVLVSNIFLFKSKGPWGWLAYLLNETKEGVQCMLVKLFACKAAWLKTSRAKESGLRQLLQIVLHQGLPDNDTVAVYKTARQVQKGDHYKVNNNHIKLRKQTNKQTKKDWTKQY